MGINTSMIPPPPNLNSSILVKPINFTYFEHTKQVLEVPEYDQQALEDLGTGLEQQLTAMLLIQLSAACLCDLK